MPSSYTYNVTPATQEGSGIYGAVAGATEIPDVYQQLSDVYPELGGTNVAASGALLSQLQGRLSDETIRNIQDAAARFGVSSGMPGSGLQWNRALRDIGLSTEQLQQQGLQNYSSVIPAVSRTQTVTPETQISTSQANAALAAQANPEEATNYALDLYNEYLDRQDPNSARNLARQMASNAVQDMINRRTGNYIGGPSTVSGSFGRQAGPGVSANLGGTMGASPWSGLSFGPTMPSQGGGTGTAGGGGTDYSMIFGNTIGGGGGEKYWGYQPTSTGTMYLGEDTGVGDFDWQSLMEEGGFA